MTKEEPEKEIPAKIFSRIVKECLAHPWKVYPSPKARDIPNRKFSNIEGRRIKEAYQSGEYIANIAKSVEAAYSSVYDYLKDRKLLRVEVKSEPLNWKRENV